MVNLPDDVVRMIKNPDTNKCMATTSADGTAHPIVCGSLTVGDSDTIIFGEVFINQTKQNLERDPRAEFILWKGRESYTIKATAIERLESGPAYDKMNMMLGKMNMSVIAVWLFKADSVWDSSATNTAGTRVV